MDKDEITPPPLDAYATAKPDEPTWTVQGGDPLSAPLLRVWAAFARLMAGVVTPGVLDGIFAELRTAANNNLPENERDIDGLLIRATRTEEVSWDMDAYRKGGNHAEARVEAADDTPEELARIDLHDLRVRSTQKINNMVAELKEIDEELAKRGFTDARCYDSHLIVGRLQDLSHVIEPRRVMKGPSNVGA